MSAEAAFDALRAYKRELCGDGLTQGDVDAFNAIFGTWKHVEPNNPTALSDAAAFFASVRKSFGPLTEPQVQGFQALLQAFGVAQWPLAWAAYGLSTAWHETAAQMQPVREAYWLSEDWRKANLRYYPWYGRGYAQLTWRGDDKLPHYGYARADIELGLAGTLLTDPDLALKPDIAARIMVHGMEEGWFSGRALKDYLPQTGPASNAAYVLARHIINGTDKADVIAKEALQFEAALIKGGWR